MEPLKSWPAAFDAQAQKINEIVEGLKPLLDISGTDGVKVTYSDNSITIGFDDGESGGGPGGSLPAGSAGDVLYNDGSSWVVLAAPTVSLANPVLRHDGTAPYWEEPEEC